MRISCKTTKKPNPKDFYIIHKVFCLSNLDISTDQTTKVIPYNSKISRINKCMKKLVNLLLYFVRTDRKS